MMRHSVERSIPAVVAGCAIVLGIALAAVHGADAPKDEWKAPAYAAKKKNPVPADEKAIAAGKESYLANCLSCHGEGGKGDGPAAPSLERPPGDLTSAKTQEQSDGSMFWKISTGRKPMPPVPKEVSETERWQIVDYVRTFKK